MSIVDINWEGEAQSNQTAMSHPDVSTQNINPVGEFYWILIAHITTSWDVTHISKHLDPYPN